MEEGRGRAEIAACCHCRLISAALAASWEKFWGGLLPGTPLHWATCAAPTPSQLASRSVPPLHPAELRGAEPLHRPGLAGRVFPEPPRPEQ